MISWKKIVSASIVFSLMLLHSPIEAEAETGISGMHEPTVILNKTAEWIDREDGLAKITLTEKDTYTKSSGIIGKTDYLFMADNSRSVVINNYLLNGIDGIPTTEACCPCLNSRHCYFIGGEGYRLISYDAGFSISTGIYRSGFCYIYRLWKDRNHYNMDTGKYITIRYANGCTDILTYTKKAIIEMVRQIQAREDGSRVAYWAYGDEDVLWNEIGYTTDYEAVILAVKTTMMFPGSYYSKALKHAIEVCNTQEKSLSTKVVFMGDGNPSSDDVTAATRAAEQLRSLPGIILNTVAIGTIQSSAQYRYMLSLAGNITGNCYVIYNEFDGNMIRALSAFVNKSVEVPAEAENKVLYDELKSDTWEFGGNFLASAGKAYCENGRIVWQIPKGDGAYTCSFEIQLKESAQMTDRNLVADTNQTCCLDYKIVGGQKHGENRELFHNSPALSYGPSDITVTAIELEEGEHTYKKSEKEYFVKGGEEINLSFRSDTVKGYERWSPNHNFFLIHNSQGESQGTIESQLPMTEFTGSEEICSLSQKSGIEYVASESMRSMDYRELATHLKIKMNVDKAAEVFYPWGKASNQYVTKESALENPDKEIRLICDANDPMINSSEIQEMISEDTALNFTASDDGSGIKEGSFSIEIINQDLKETRVIQSEGNEITGFIDLSDPFFSGILQMTVRVSDHVGNIAEKIYHLNVFALEAEIVRETPPHIPYFATGEAGVLQIRVNGFAERVEVIFPAEFSDFDEHLNKIIELEPGSNEIENQDFFIPIDVKEGRYLVEVAAYKGGHVKKAYPYLVVDGNILDELRTRIRSF